MKENEILFRKVISLTNKFLVQEIKKHWKDEARQASAYMTCVNSLSCHGVIHFTESCNAPISVILEEFKRQMEEHIETYLSLKENYNG